MCIYIEREDTTDVYIYLYYRNNFRALKTTFVPKDKKSDMEERQDAQTKETIFPKASLASEGGVHLL